MEWTKRLGGNQFFSTMGLAQLTFTSNVWTQVCANTGFAVGAIYWEGGGTTTGQYIQIGVGASGSEVAIGPPIAITLANGIPVPFVVPVNIPAGVRVAVYIDNLGSGNVKGNLALMGASGRWAQRYTLQTINSAPVSCATSGTIAVPGSWVQLTANSPACSSLFILGSSAAPSGEGALEVGIGASGSQQSITGLVPFGEGQIHLYLDKQIPGGSALWARSTYATATVTNIFVQALGLS